MGVRQANDDRSWAVSEGVRNFAYHTGVRGRRKLAFRDHASSRNGERVALGYLPKGTSLVRMEGPFDSAIAIRTTMNVRL